MPVLILAMVFAVMQAPPPMPRKATDDQARQTQKGHSKANAGQQNAVPATPAAISPSAPEGKEAAGTEGKKNTEETIRVRELPPVTIKTGPDWWNRAYVLFTAALVFIGLFGVRYAHKSLCSIESQLAVMREQTAILKTSVDAALLSAKALVSAERARVDIELVPDGGTRYSLSARNHGRSTAYIGIYSFTRHFYPANKPLPDNFRDGQFQQERHAINRTLPAGEKRMMVTRDFAELLSETQRAGEEQAIFRLSVSYEDVFSEGRDALHETELVYRYDISSGELVILDRHCKYT